MLTEVILKHIDLTVLICQLYTKLLLASFGNPSVIREIVNAVCEVNK